MIARRPVTSGESSESAALIGDNLTYALASSALVNDVRGGGSQRFATDSASSPHIVDERSELYYLTTTFVIVSGAMASICCIFFLLFVSNQYPNRSVLCVVLLARRRFESNRSRLFVALSQQAVSQL